MFLAKLSKKMTLAQLSFCLCVCVLVYILFLLYSILAFWPISAEFAKAIGVSKDTKFLQVLCKQAVGYRRKTLLVPSLRENCHRTIGFLRCQ